MSEYGAILLVLVLIYLIECVAWVPASGAAFRCRADRAWSAAEEWLTVFGGRWRAVVGDVVPGAGGIAVGERGLPPVSPAGICTRPRGAPPARDGRCFVPFEAIRQPKADGVRVLDGGRLLASAGTEVAAGHLAALIARLAREDERERAARLETEMTRLLDLRAARRRVRLWSRCGHALDSGGRLLAVLIFGVLPIGLLWGGIYGAMPALAAAGLVTAAQIGQFARLRRRIRVAGAAGQAMWTMGLTPPAAIRAADLLARETFGPHHGLALAAAACTPGEARAMASRVIRRIRYPLGVDEEACCAAEAWSRAFQTRRLEAWIECTHGPLEGLLRPPRPESADAVAYCPRCLQQYVRVQPTCADCPGVALRRFDS